MFKSLAKYPEWRILGVLGVITLAWHLFTIFGGIIGNFADIILLVIVSWVLAFLIEPAVTTLTKKGLSRVEAAVAVYLVVAIVVIGLIWVVLPTTVTQLSQLASGLPALLPPNSIWSARLATFLEGTINNSILWASSVASALTNLFFIFILSLYFLISRAEISKFILQVIPADFAEDYKFLENVINTTFASFIRIQFILGLILGAAALVVLWLLRVDLAVSTAIAAAALAMIPVVGPVLLLVPVALATLTVSVQTMIIAVAILVLVAQIVYNVLAPRLLGEALKIHPIIVLLSFLVGFKIAGLSGAVLAVPVVSALSIIGAEVLKYWKEEADKG